MLIIAWLSASCLGVPVRAASKKPWTEAFTIRDIEQMEAEKGLHGNEA